MGQSNLVSTAIFSCFFLFLVRIWPLGFVSISHIALSGARLIPCTVINVYYEGAQVCWCISFSFLHIVFWIGRKGRDLYTAQLATGSRALENQKRQVWEKAWKPTDWRIDFLFCLPISNLFFFSSRFSDPFTPRLCTCRDASFRLPCSRT